MTAGTIDPDDGNRRGPATREDEGEVRFLDRGRFRYISFPVRWDAEGRVAGVALEGFDTETGASEYVIVHPGLDNGSADPDHAPHEQLGPVPAWWWSEHAAPRCAALTRAGRRCRNHTHEDPSGMCAVHRKKAIRGRE